MRDPLDLGQFIQIINAVRDEELVKVAKKKKREEFYKLTRVLQSQYMNIPMK